MARTLQQEKITLVIRQDLMEQANAEGEASGLNTAELVRRAVDLYLTQFPVPAFYETGDLLPETQDADNPPVPVRKLPIHINTGLLGELDRYALQMRLSPDEVANRALVLYSASLAARREAAEEYGEQGGYTAQGEPGQPVEEPVEDEEGAAAEPVEEPAEDGEDAGAADGPDVEQPVEGPDGEEPGEQPGAEGGPEVEGEETYEGGEYADDTTSAPAPA
jgi:hypothetical protein